MIKEGPVNREGFGRGVFTFGSVYKPVRCTLSFEDYGKNLSELWKPGPRKRGGFL
jgi:hypothetical protein